MNKEIDALVAKVFGSGLDERECSVMTKEDFLDALMEARALGLEEAAELAEHNTRPRLGGYADLYQRGACETRIALAKEIRALKGE